MKRNGDVLQAGLILPRCHVGKRLLDDEELLDEDDDEDGSVNVIT